MPKQGELVNHLPPLRVPQVDSALDWAWLVDLGQGNFAAAKVAAEKALLGGRNAYTLFARAVIHHLQGEYAQASPLFEEAFISTPDLKHKYIIAVTAYLTENQAEEIFPDGFWLSFDTHPLPWDNSNHNSEWAKRYLALRQEIENPHIQLTGEFVAIIASYPVFRTLISELTDQVQRKQYAEKIQEILTQQLQLAQELNEDKIIAALYTLVAELLALEGQIEEALKIIARLAHAYQESGNYLGVAWCFLSQGDLIASPVPLGRPILFGYPLRNLGKDEIFNCVDRTNIDFSAVHDAYFDARQYFAAAIAPRGEAMAILRLAYLDGIASSWHLAAQGYEEARQRFLSLGDRLGAMAAEMGKLWTWGYAGAPEQDGIKSAEIFVREALDNDAIAWALSCGLVFAYAAKDALVNDDNPEAALRFMNLTEAVLVVYESEILQPKSLKLVSKVEEQIELFYCDLAQLFAEKGYWDEAFLVAEMVRQNARSNISIEPKKDNKTLSVKEVATLLPSGALLLAYFVFETKLLAWAVTSAGLVGQYKLEVLNGEPFVADSFAKIVCDWLGLIREGKTDPTLCKIFTESLLAPFDAQIAQAEHLVIVPSAQLNPLPFNTLPWRAASLGLQKSLSYLPTASALKDFRATDPNAEGTIAIAIPEIASLTRSATESIAKLYGIKPLIGIVATKKAVLTQIKCRPKIFHLDTQRNTSGLVLAGGEILTTEDWFNVDLTADVVVLSLGTAQKNILPDRELFRLTQSLICAGARAVVINLWRVDELATAMLVQFLHKGLRVGQPLALSLWEAQQQLCCATLQQALDFCTVAQANIPWKKELDRVDRAILTKCMGDIMAFGGDYIRAAEAYGVASQILTAAGYATDAETLKNKHLRIKSLAKSSSKFNPNQLIFNSPKYWAAFKIIGDWQL